MKYANTLHILRLQTGLTNPCLYGILLKNGKYYEGR